MIREKIAILAAIMFFSSPVPCKLQASYILTLNKKVQQIFLCDIQLCKHRNSRTKMQNCTVH